VNGPQANGRRRTPSHRLGYEIPYRQFLRLVREIRHVLAACDNENLLWLEDGGDSIHGVLEHSASPDQFQ
jgi:hypothetical protein